MKISVIVSWPDGFDFPLFRDSLSELKKHVHEIIICFNKHGNHSLRDWLKEEIDDVIFLDVESDDSLKGDWRSKSTNHMLNHATGDWILSLEQDFFIESYPHFFHTVKRNSHNDVIMFEDGNRFHPACMFIKKETLLKTRRDFSVMGQGRDHFSAVSKELKGIGTYITFQSLGLFNGEDWEHLQGLTDNYFAPKPYFNLPRFYEYNDDCKKVEPMSIYWKQEMERCNENIM